MPTLPAGPAPLHGGLGPPAFPRPHHTCPPIPSPVQGLATSLCAPDSEWAFKVTTGRPDCTGKPMGPGGSVAVGTERPRGQLTGLTRAAGGGLAVPLTAASLFQPPSSCGGPAWAA